MSVQGGPYITNNGLVLAVDFANAESYVSGSSTVYNLDPIVSSSTGSLFNGPVFVNENFGALSFDGTNDYVRINNFTGLPTGSSPRTVSIWFNTTSGSWVGDVNNLFFYGANSNTQAFGIDFSTYPTMEAYTWGGGNSDFAWTSSFLQRGWKNLTITYNGSNTLSIYENGSLRTSKTNLVTTNTSNTDIWLGSINPTIAANHFDGKISSLKIYNRALSSSEVLQAYNSEFGRYKRTTPINEGLYLITGSTALNTVTQSSFLVNTAYTGSHLLLLGGAGYRSTTLSNVSDSKGNKWNIVHSLNLGAVPGTAFIAVGEIISPLASSDAITITFATTQSNAPGNQDTNLYLYKIQASQWVAGQGFGTYTSADIIATSSIVYNYPSYHVALGSLGQFGFINGILTKTIECETLLDTGAVFLGGMRFFERSYPISGSVRMGMTPSVLQSAGLAMVSFL